jgi:spore coat protein A
VNGKAWPFLVVKPRRYRFRLVNAGNARVYSLSLTSNLSFTQIGSDGGLLDHPQTLTLITVAPAERVDFVIDFALVAGQDVILHNSALVPYPDGDPVFTPPSTRTIMKFKVKKFDADDAPNSPAIPTTLRDADPAVNLTAALLRTFTMIEMADKDDFPIGSLLSNRTWTDPVTETPYLASTEVWEFINLTPDAHPMHIHLVKFKVLNLQAFNLTLYEEGGCDRFEEHYRGPGSCISEPSVAPMAYHAGWKDTVVSLPGHVTRLVLHWSPEYGGEFPFDATAKPGYLWHCHILDHEDNDMMRPIQLLRRS